MNGMTDAYMTGTIFASIFDLAKFFSLFTYSYQTYVLFFTECSVKTNVMATVTLYGPMVRRMKGKWTLFFGYALMELPAYLSYLYSLHSVSFEMDNVKVKAYTNLVTVENMKDHGVMGDTLVLVFVHGKMVDVTRGMLTNH